MVVRGDEVVVIRRAARSRVLALPKGEPNGDETPSRPPRARSARRPASRPSRDQLGDVRYLPAWRPARAKRAFYLFDFVAGSTADHDHEVDDVRWMPLERGRDAPQLPGRARDDRARAVQIVAATGRLPRRAGPELLLDRLRRPAQARAARRRRSGSATSRTSTARTSSSGHHRLPVLAARAALPRGHRPRRGQARQGLSPRDIEHDNPEFRRTRS